ncbi:hypothetical protein RhiirA5_348595 [Rhizophagus irregularis]|uniref:Uncharacterized protein n=1 Tax=Rhizophagus irregularis TaxID=588596 RepID=A0A2I1E2F7_9GLOM|nr:hypothetical protein RhiirA5_348595 [Rhizophagus irregularis]PKC73050.1 hypothetical protein RhiirA1_411039 [Rhizophagus irregularis]PKK79123.1 hypothetical protein RhiirC2_728041 [Rhizophagus irregularis]PKY16324.1 hypothetical protein RhiirB3_402719 [Rhizophagus irregularis]CAB4377077.1 unnamed protein product [Rhizophagus irregularis]
MSELEQKLSALKNCFDMGYITEDLYNKYSRRILDEWSKKLDDEKPFWRRMFDKAISFGHTILANLISAIVSPFRLITDR